jgi:hypothetical protein
MSQALDTWYVRLPDGRVLRAASTEVVRRHIDSGRIPTASRVRRSPNEEWAAIDWTEEFADIVRHRVAEDAADEDSATTTTGTARALFKPEIASRYDPSRIKTVGLRGLVEELIAALDNTLARPKLLVAGALGGISALIIAIVPNLHTPDQALWRWMPTLVATAIIFIGAVMAGVLLTQMTYTELSRLRPSTWTEARNGLAKFAARLFVCAGITAGAIGGGLWALHVWTPADIATRLSAWLRPEITVPVISVLMLFLELLLWAVLPFTMLLGPVVVVEEGSMGDSLAQWWWLIRRHLGRLVLYESAAAITGVAMLAFGLPFLLTALSRRSEWGRVDTPIGIGLCLLAGLAAAPLIAYFAVAHVFIYLNLRYQSDGSN